MTDTSTPEAEGGSAPAPARSFQSDALQRLLKAAAEREQQQPEPELTPEPLPKRPAISAWRPAQPKREPQPVVEETLDLWGEAPATASARPAAPEPIGAKAASARSPLARPQLTEIVPAQPVQNNGLMIVVVAAALIAAVAIWLMVFSS